MADATAADLPPLQPAAAPTPGVPMLGALGGYAAQPDPAPLPPLPAAPAASASQSIGWLDAVRGKDSAPLPPIVREPGTFYVDPATGRMVDVPNLPIPAQPIAVQSSMAAPTPVAVPAEAMHAAAPSQDELAQHAATVARAYQQQAGNVDHAARLEAKAIDTQAELDKKAAAASLQVQTDYQTEQTKMLAEQAKQRDFFATRQAAAAKAVDDASAAAAQTPFDANRYVKNMGVGETSLTMLSLIFGGIGQAFGGGPSAGLGMLNRRIEADVETQRMGYEKARQTVADKRGAYAMLRDQGMTDEQARQGATAAQYAKLQSQLALVGAQYAGPQAEARRQALQAHLESGRVQAQGKVMESVLDEGHKELAERQQQAVIDAQAFGPARLDQADVHRKEMEQLTIPGLGGHAKTAEEHSKAVLVEQSYRKLMPMLGEMEQMRRENGRNLVPYSPEVSARAENLANQIHLLGKDLFQLGVLSEGDNKLLNKIFPENPTAVFKLDGSIYGQLSQFRKNAEEGRRSQLQTWGFEIPRPGHDVMDAPMGERVAQ